MLEPITFCLHPCIARTIYKYCTWEQKFTLYNLLKKQHIIMCNDAKYATFLVSVSGGIKKHLIPNCVYLFSGSSCLWLFFEMATIPLLRQKIFFFSSFDSCQSSFFLAYSIWIWFITVLFGLLSNIPAWWNDLVEVCKCVIKLASEWASWDF